MKSARVHAGLWLLGLLAMLVPAGVILAQSDDEMAGAAVAGVAVIMLLVGLVIGLAFYVYGALALSTIAKKTNVIPKFASHDVLRKPRPSGTCGWRPSASWRCPRH